MRLEAEITLLDLTKALEQLLPLRIHFETEEDQRRWLGLERPTAIELVANEGLRVTCPASVDWSTPVGGFPFRLDALRVLARPSVALEDDHPVLAFHFRIEEADIASVPALVEAGVAATINHRLASRPVAWDFTRTLTHSFWLPPRLDPPMAMCLASGASTCIVTAERLLLSVDLAIDFHRGPEDRVTAHLPAS